MVVDLRASHLCAISSPLKQAADTEFTHKVVDELLPATETHMRLYRSRPGKEESDESQVDQDTQHENDENADENTGSVVNERGQVRILRELSTLMNQSASVYATSVLK